MLYSTQVSGFAIHRPLREQLLESLLLLVALLLLARAHLLQFGKDRGVILDELVRLQKVTLGFIVVLQCSTPERTTIERLGCRQEVSLRMSTAQECDGTFIGVIKFERLQRSRRAIDRDLWLANSDRCKRRVQQQRGEQGVDGVLKFGRGVLW